MANPIAFQGQNVVYTHPDCFDLPVCRQTTMLGNEATIEVISAAFMLSMAGLLGWKVEPTL